MLTVAFIALAGVGCLYVLVGAFLGHHFDFSAAHGHAGHDGSGGHEQQGASASAYGLSGQGHGSAAAGHGGAPVFHFPFFSPLALATLAAMVGGFGLIALHGFHLSEGLSLAAALPAALAATYLVTYVAFKLTADAKASSLIRSADLVGALGEVTTPIPAGGVGEVVAILGGQRLSGPARESEGREVPRGATVTVVRMAGPTYVVTVAAK
ncbi:MAG TPA: NfeD family protein [Thermoanaerobaculia bacterium]